ncbi:MAG: hypothetical protein D6762_01125 [Candidatus Neomarinimicrobiota bacterium]|nr:MAG: hypothetical protein D6762_01125 [Candidatus Neomarinimicrobiota bacterium]
MWLISLVLMTRLGGQMPDCTRCHSSRELSLQKTAGFSEKAVGVMDKGQMQVNTSNFGDLADFHVWFTNSAHWPRQAPDDHQYLFGLGFMVGIDSTNVIETVTQAQSRVTDWLPPDDAAGHDYSGDVKAVSDQTPFQASSDFRETWPRGYWTDTGWQATEERVWPGYFRIDVNHPDFPHTLVEREGEFTSDRDVYCTYTDAQNSKGAVGLLVEQTGYSYGRPYGEDFVIWDLKLHNQSGRNLDDMYVGFLAKIRPDYDNHDYVDFWDTDDDGQRDMVVIYDLNNTPNRTWASASDPMAAIGLRVFDTPGNLGITGFHHFPRGATPTTDEELWALMTGNRRSPALIDPSHYFHGSDPLIDYTGLDSLASYYPAWLDEESGVELEGEAINFIVSTGPFTLPADSVVDISIGLIAGDTGPVPDQPDFTDLWANVRTANTMHSYFFQGSGPPPPPVVGAVPGDGTVTLYWSAEPSESSVDVLTQKRDFEGYKIFRSLDQGRTWGDVITDAQGYPVGYRPLAIFDVVDDVSGEDPAFPQYLGSNSGLSHTYVDSNLVNGVEYWYCVTAYDRGNQNPDSLEQSYMYPLGSSDLEQHTVSVVPGAAATDWEESTVPTEDLTPAGGSCDGTVTVELVDPAAVTGHGYRLTFEDQVPLVLSPAGTTYGLGLTLVDTTVGETLLVRQPLSDDTGDNIPVVDGFRLHVTNPPAGVKSMGWTRVSGDTCTFDWRVESIDPSAGAQLIQGDIHTIDDWRIVVDYSGGDSLNWIDLFTDIVQPEKQWVPIRIEIITDPVHPRDVTRESWLGDFAIPAPWDTYRKYYYSPLGWDLEPGGKGYVPGSPGWYEKHVDILILEHDSVDAVTGDTLPNYLYLFTNNKPDSSYNVAGELEVIDAHAPSDGDEFTILTYKPFREGLVYRFGTTAGQRSTDLVENPLSRVQVVPDPYVVTNAWETSEFGKKLQFNHLPARCTIRIYTLMGEELAVVPHDNTQGYEFWNMRTRHDQFIAPGVYLYHITSPGGWETSGRFLVIK